MKIWCLHCGCVLAETRRSKRKEIICPACGQRVRFSVDLNVGHITMETAGSAANQDLLIYHI